GEDAGSGAQGGNYRVLRRNLGHGREGGGSHRVAAAAGEPEAASGECADQHAGARGRNAAWEDAAARSAGDGASDCDGADSDACFTRAIGGGGKAALGGGGD